MCSVPTLLPRSYPRNEERFLLGQLSLQHARLVGWCGIVDFGGVPRYTDAAFKVKLPSADFGTIALYGLGGRSAILDEDRGVADDTLFSRTEEVWIVWVCWG